LIAIFLIADIRPFYNANAAMDEGDINSELKSTQKELDKNLEKETALNSEYYQVAVQVTTTKSKIEQTAEEITRKETEIKNLNDQVTLYKKFLTTYLQEVYFGNQDPVMKLAVANQSLDAIFGNDEQMLNVKEKILRILEEISASQLQLGEVKEELADKKEEHESLLQQQKAEQYAIANNIQETKLTIAQLQAKQSKLRSALSNFLGEDFDMNDVIDAVKYADKKTGVRKEFLFAVLDKETDLGRFTGGCTYKKSKMGDTNLKYFKEICDDLGYDYKKMKVSCALSYGIGGAMGVAQFMPSTWMGYKDAIASSVGHSPANPWKLKDGIMGMALYLKNKGGDRKSGEHTAAAAYYCGSNLSRDVCQNYANTVISWSKGYDEYF